MRVCRTSFAVAILGLVIAADARAGLGGLCALTSAPAAGDAQVSFPACVAETRPAFKLVYDADTEKRFHVVHQTVPKPVTRTGDRVACATGFKSAHEVGYQTVPETVMRPVVQTVVRDMPVTVCRPVYECQLERRSETICQPVTETGYRHCHFKVCRAVTETCYRPVHYMVCRQVCETHCKTERFQACKTVTETRCVDKCEIICRPVTETRYKSVCRTTCKPVTETTLRTVCRTMYRECVQTVMKTKTHTVCEPVCTMKTVVRKVPEVRCETYTVPGSVKTRCVPRVMTWCDPLTGQVMQKQVGADTCVERGPCETRTRPVLTYRTVCEQVPVTTYVKRTICEQVPETVCKKVPYVVTERVPVTVSRMVKETRTDQVPYTVTRLVKETCRRVVPVTTTREVKGCYCDATTCGVAPGPNGVVSGLARASSVEGSDQDGPGRVFVEGGMCTRVVPVQRLRTVREFQVRREPYTVNRHMLQTFTCRVPYTMTRLAPVTVERLVPVMTCRLVPETCVRPVALPVCVMQPQVGYRRVPVCVTKTVPVCRELDGGVRRAGWVCGEETGAGPTCASPYDPVGPWEAAGSSGSVFEKVLKHRLGCGAGK